MQEAQELEESTNSASTVESEGKAERLTSQSHIEIKQESVNYLGYYSSHEQLMQELMSEHAKVNRKKIQDMVQRGKF